MSTVFASVSTFSIILPIFALLSFLASLCSAQMVLAPIVPYKALGASFFINCKVDDGIKFKSLKWYNAKNEEILSNTGSETVSTEMTLSKSLDLNFNNVKSKYSGGYICKAVLENGKVISRNYTLIIYQEIKFTDAPEEQQGPEGTDHLVKCVAKSKPNPAISWQYNKKSFKEFNSSRHEIVDGGLMIHNVSRKDNGNYKCVAKMVTDYVSQIKQRNIKFIVQYSPECEKSPKTVYSYIGGKVKMTCTANALPAPNFVWYRYDIPLDNSTDGIQVVYDEEGSTLEMIIDNITMFGEYMCEASNFLGRCSYKITLSEVVKPGVPDLVDITSGATGSMKLTVKAPKQSVNKNEPSMTASITKIKVQYKKSNESWESAKIANFEYGSKPYEIKSLEHEIQYSVRVAAGSDVGFGNYSQEKSYKLVNKKVSSKAAPMLAPLTRFIPLPIVAAVTLMHFFNM